MEQLGTKIRKTRILYTVISSLIILFFILPLKVKADHRVEDLNKKISENLNELEKVKTEIENLGIIEKMKRKIPLTEGEIRAYKQLQFKLDRIANRTLKLTTEQLKNWKSPILNY